MNCKLSRNSSVTSGLKHFDSFNYCKDAFCSRVYSAVGKILAGCISCVECITKKAFSMTVEMQIVLTENLLFVSPCG